MKKTFLSSAGLLFAAMFAFLSPAPDARADEHFFGSTRGVETLPQGKADLYQFFTARWGKDSGHYLGLDFDTEVEYGFTDRLTLGFSVTQDYFHVRGNEELGSIEKYRFGGFEASAKYNVLSPFKDGIGLAFRLQTSYLFYDDVGGFQQQEILASPGVLVQKNFLDDTLIVALNFSVDWAWGKEPAEEYNKEVSFNGEFGVTYRFAPNWFFGVEARIRAEYPLFDLGFHEHSVVFAGPALHYGGQKWWATLSYGYQVWGSGVDEPPGHTFAEETQNELRLKIGFNF